MVEVRPCEWPCNEFMRAAGIYEDFYWLANNAGLTDFLHDQRERYLLLTNIFTQNFHFHAKKTPPTVEVRLYDEVKKYHSLSFVKYARYHLKVDLMNHVVKTLKGLLT